MTVRRLINSLSKATFIALLVLLFAEVFLSLFSVVTKWGRETGPEKKYGIGKLMTKGVYDGYSEDSVRRLLEETYNPLTYEAYTMFKEIPKNGKYVNISKAGFRHVDRQAPFPPDEKDVNIFVFGGSTTFGYGVADTETVASFLQNRLRSKLASCNVFNFGRGYYYSTQERILLGKLITSGVDIDMAVFVDGANEKGQRDLPSLNHEMSRGFEVMCSDSIILAAKRLVNTSMIGRCIDSVRRLVIGEGKSEKFKKKRPKQQAMQDGKDMFERYIMSKRMIEATCAEFNIKCYFVWQPVNWLEYDQQYHPFSYVPPDYEWGQQYLYMYMKEYVETGACQNMLYLGDIQKDMKRPLYVDAVHYNSYFSKIIADRIAAVLLGDLAKIVQ